MIGQQPTHGTPATISATRVSMLSSEQYTNLLMKMDIR